MSEGHPGTRKPHHSPSHFPLSRFIAVNRTAGAGRLVFAVRAFLKAFLCISHQASTIRAQFRALMILVVMVAINVGHAHQGVVFAFQTASEFTHALIIVVFSSHLFDPYQRSPSRQAFVMLTHHMPRLLLRTICLLLCLIFAGCHQEPLERKAQFLIFGTLLEVSLWDTSAETAQQAFSELQEMFQGMHNDWHAWEPGQLTEINRAFEAGLPASASRSIVELVEHSQQAELKTGGRFNSAIGALVGLWGFHTSEYPIEGPPPAGPRIRALVARAPSSLDIRINGQELSSSNSAVQLDFGGIAKGYAIDIACEHLKSLGIENAIVNAGGDLRTLGNHGARPWRIAVRNPGGGIIGTLETARDEAVFTSGNYERFRQDELKRYPHILDPRTGWPVQNIASVTVIAQQGWLADAAATALIVAGLDEWQEVAVALGLDQVMLVDESGKAWLTEKMNERLEFVEGIEKEIVRF